MSVFGIPEKPRAQRNLGTQIEAVAGRLGQPRGQFIGGEKLRLDDGSGGAGIEDDLVAATFRLREDRAQAFVADDQVRQG